MVSVAQLVEPWIVIPVVVGSSPITHPIPLAIFAVVARMSAYLAWLPDKMCPASCPAENFT